MPSVSRLPDTGFDAWIKRELEGTAARREGMPQQAGFAGDDLIPYFDMADLDATNQAPVDEDRKRYLQHMRKMGNLRSLRKVPDTFNFEDIGKRFPNFSQVTEFLRQQVGLCRLSERKTAAFQPLLLLGDPGVGKTRYMLEMARCLGLEFEVVQCGSVSASFVLSGSSTSWKSGKPGKMHTALRDGATANPIVLLDEIDKLSGAQDYDAHGPLYQLLEMRTAQRFTDEAIDIPMDCSHMIWVATANNLHAIPEPIVSRMVVIEVPAPSSAQSPDIARSVYHDILAEHEHTWGAAFSPNLPDALISSLDGHVPREMRKTLLAACGCAALTAAESCKGRPLGTVALTLPDLDGMPAKRDRRVGF